MNFTRFCRHLNLLFLLFFCIITCAPAYCAPGNTKTSTSSTSAAITNFAIKFISNVDKSKNAISSPLSAEILLALLTLGSTEPAHSELLTSLGVSDDDSIRSSFSDIATRLKALQGVTLNIANKVYIQEGPYDLHPELKEDANKVFDAAMEKVNFGDSASTVQAINQWVQNNTNNKITDLLSEDSVDDTTILVLVNALYFKGTWKKQFDTEKTRQQVFRISSNSEVQVPMMYIEDHFAYRYSRELQAELLELPYEGDDTSMLIVLPFKVEGLDDLLTKLATGYKLMSDVDKMYMSELDVLIPKFKVETEINLKELLPKLGINAIFDSNNSGITKLLNSDLSLYVSAAVQKAFIEVNEQGSEAAAATGLTIRPASLNRPFHANKPFLYLVFSGRGDLRTPLFVGTYRGTD